MKVLKSEYRYALVVIDAFSKLADAEAMKNKETETVYQNLVKNYKKQKKKVPFKCI